MRSGRRSYRLLAIALAVTTLVSGAATAAGAASWHFETIDPDQVGGIDSIGAVTYGTGPHVFYLRQTANELRHAWWTGSAWATETLDGDANGPNGRSANDMAVRGIEAFVWGSFLHVFYNDETAQDLRHAWWNGSGWQRETLDGNVADPATGRITGWVGSDPNAILFGGQLHLLSYQENPGMGVGSDLRHAWWTGSGWQHETLDGHANGPFGQHLGSAGGDPGAFVFGNQLHVFHADLNAPGCDQRHSWWNGIAWQHEAFDTNAGCDNSAVIFGGTPHVFSRGGIQYRLRHAWWNGVAWQRETLDGAGSAGPDVVAQAGVAVTSTLVGGTPHLWYAQVSTGFDLRHAWWNGGGWQRETLDGHQVGPNGQVSSSVGAGAEVLGSSGLPHAFYYDSLNLDLRHAWYG